MQSRVQPAIAKLFDQPGFKGTKHDVREAVHCDKKTAGRVLCDLWINNNIYVCGWVHECGGPLAVYAKRDKGQPDAPKPVPLREVPFMEREVDHVYAQRRERARLNKVLSGDIRLGVWGL